jgi:N-acetylmuramoyl-L-alanine amidase
VGPAMNLRIDVRRASHLIVVGDVRVPQITPRFERQGPNGELTFDIQPVTAHRVSRDGNRLTIRFEADALDAAPIAGAQPEFVGSTRVDGASLVIELGPSAVTSRSDDGDPAHLTIDLLAASPGNVPGRPVSTQEPPPVVDLTPSGVVRTIVIDPGHGGEDTGVRGPGGTLEKDITLQIARRLKAAIESRVGLHVLLTRETDETVAVDRRTALANNSKADLLFSLHVNASMQPTLRGAEVLSLGLEDYKDRARGLGAGTPVPLAGGGTRVLVAVPWDLAQIPYAARSASLAAVLVRHLVAVKVNMYARATDQAPLRILVGANMPAVLVELGFLSNADDEHALGGNDVPSALVEALLATIVEVRNGLPAGGAR